MVAGYVDGIFGPEHALHGQPGWDAAGWARFPNAVRWQIAVGPSTNYGNVLDVETGDATPAQAPGWVKMRRAAGVDPIVYMNASTWPAVRSQFQLQGVPEPHYWVADYDNNPTVPAGAIAKQYANSALTGHHYDLSNVALSGGSGGPLTGDQDLTPDEHNVLVDIQNRVANALQPAISFIENDVVGGVEDNTKGIAATVHRIEAAVAKIPTTEPPEPTPTPAQPALSAQEAADIHTIADFLRKFGVA